MSNPVGGSPNTPERSKNPGQKPAPGGKASQLAHRALAEIELSEHSSLSSRNVQPGGTKQSGEGVEGSLNCRKGEVLQAWKQSLPFRGLFSEADNLISILSSIDLDQPFTVELKDPNILGSISSLPDVFQNCEEFRCEDYSNLKALPPLPNCKKLSCLRCDSLKTLPDLPNCTELYCRSCTSLQALPELPVCTHLDLDYCPSLQLAHNLTACIELNINDCKKLETLPELPNCRVLKCTVCRRLRELPRELPACTVLKCTHCNDLEKLSALPVCSSLYCHECPSLQALPDLPDFTTELYCTRCFNVKTFQVLPPNLEDCKLDIYQLDESAISDLRQQLREIAIRKKWRSQNAINRIDGVVYRPVSLPEDLKVPLTPPLPEGASIDRLKSDLERFINGLQESDLPKIKKEIPSLRDLASSKLNLSEWKRRLFERVKGRLGYTGTPPSGSKELTEFYEKIEFYLLHLDAFLSKEENQNAYAERLQILQSQNACGARFIGELEQLFSLNCVGSETAGLSHQFAQIASTEAKLAIERMFPDGNVHNINQAMFQLRDFLTGTYFKDQLSATMDLAWLLDRFRLRHTSVNLVKTIQDNLKPSSPMEELFTQYLRENFSPELTEDQVRELDEEVNQLWEETKTRKIAAFETIDPIRKKPAQELTAQEKFQMENPNLTADEKACENKEKLEMLLASKENSFRDKNIPTLEKAKKDGILYHEHYDEAARKWKPEIIAKALQKMGILEILNPPT